ncbi:MFS general substrate transporter [Penicillium verhagenii]|uniref:MFS general substrate transporter n=1 Tax=Penicillium verhagenii TaxID=1562060 RepID=UPI002544FDAC|nr:MFS general substrate transporter [Penicillium verhagenii]KAJ5924304.1 MFS general substrate transporter [Penicillium verhagenii]
MASSSIELVQLPDQRKEPTELNLQNIETSPLEDTPPNGGHGWICTFCVFMIIVHTWGINSAWGVILDHFLTNSTFPNATRIDYAFIGGLSISQALLIGPLVHKAQSIIGVKIPLLLGTVLVSGSMLGASYATEIWHLFLTQGICFGFGMGLLYIPSMSVLPHWFSSRRSLAMGIAASGAGIGGILYNLATSYIIEHLGWRTAYKILAACALGANLVSSLLLKTRKTQSIQQTQTIVLDDLKRPEVLFVIFWGMTTEFGYIALFYSLPNYATSIGLTANQGSVAGAMLNVGMTIARPLVGYISDKFGRITVPALLTAFCSVVCLAIWIPAKSYAVLLVFALLSGMVCGTFWATITPVLAEVVGLGRMSRTFAITCLALVIPTTVAEPVALSLVQQSGYLHTQIFVGCMFLLGSWGLWTLRCWKCFDIERKACYERGLGAGRSSTFLGFINWIGFEKIFMTGRV